MERRSSQNIVKFFVMGKTKVGKTSIIRRIAGKGFHVTYFPTIGTEITSHKILINDKFQKITMNNGNSSGINIDLQLIDVPEGRVEEVISKEDKSSFTGYVLVFDVTGYETFLHLSHIINKIYEINPKCRVPLIIVGNKVDSPDQKLIEEYDLEMFVENLNEDKEIKSPFIDFVMVSAKNNEDIDTIIKKLITPIFDKLPFMKRNKLIKSVYKKK